MVKEVVVVGITVIHVAVEVRGWWQLASLPFTVVVKTEGCGHWHNWSDCHKFGRKLLQLSADILTHGVLGIKGDRCWLGMCACGSY